MHAFYRNCIIYAKIESSYANLNKDTAMGTAAAPNYANLFMDRFETKAHQIGLSNL